MNTKTPKDTMTIKIGKKETTFKIKEVPHKGIIFHQTKYAPIYERIEALKPNRALTLTFDNLNDIKALQIQLYKTSKKYKLQWRWQILGLTINIWTEYPETI